MTETKVITARGNIRVDGSTITILANKDLSVTERDTFYPYLFSVDIPEGCGYRATSPVFEVSPSFVTGSWSGDFYLSPFVSKSVAEGEPVIVLTLWRRDSTTKVVCE